MTAFIEIVAYKNPDNITCHRTRDLNNFTSLFTYLIVEKIFLTFLKQFKKYSHQLEQLEH